MMKANVTETKEYKGSKQPKEGTEIKIIAKQRCSLLFPGMI